MEIATIASFWAGTAPDWIMAIAAAGAAIVFFWRRQDRLAQQKLADEQIRVGVQAHWITIPGEAGEKDQWGVLVTNGLPSPITQVRLACTGNALAADQGITCRAIPAGSQRFIQSAPKTDASTRGASRPWVLPRQLEAGTAVTEITPGTKSVDRVEFTYLGREFAHDGTGTALAASEN